MERDILQDPMASSVKELKGALMCYDIGKMQA
jgi:hypothetical protein